MESEVKESRKVESTREVFKNNPKYLKTLVNKTVEITTVNGKTHKGIVFVIDPVSESVVTVANCNDKCDVNIFMGHAIQSIRKISEDNENASHNSVFNTAIQLPNDTQFTEKKTNLMSWLKKNLLDVTEEDLNLRIGDDLVIEPPYDKAHCFCSNTIILQRIQDIINKMPDGK